VLPIELMKKKGDRAALQHGTIFARYTVIASFLILAIMFGKGFIETIKDIQNKGIMYIISLLLVALMLNPYLFFGYIVAIALFILATVFAFL
jgi:monomeric isocitrate dehydrogenase